MTATYTFDVFTSLDGNASYGPPGDWGGYWGKHGPEFLDHRLKAYDGQQRMVFGATTFISSTLQAPLDWPDATVVSGDAVEAVRRMKDDSDVPIRSHGSLTLNRA